MLDVRCLVDAILDVRCFDVRCVVDAILDVCCPML